MRKAETMTVEITNKRYRKERAKYLFFHWVGNVGLVVLAIIAITAILGH